MANQLTFDLALPPPTGPVAPTAGGSADSGGRVRP